MKTLTEQYIEKSEELLELLSQYFEWDYFIPSPQARNVYLELKSELASLKKQIKEPDKTAEEILENAFYNNTIRHTPYIPDIQGIIKVMQEYASQQTEKYKELMGEQDKLIKELSESEPACMYVKELEDKIEQLKTELGL